MILMVFVSFVAYYFITSPLNGNRALVSMIDPVNALFVVSQSSVPSGLVQAVNPTAKHQIFGCFDFIQAPNRCYVRSRFEKLRLGVSFLGDFL